MGRHNSRLLATNWLRLLSSGLYEPTSLGTDKGRRKVRCVLSRPTLPLRPFTGFDLAVIGFDSALVSGNQNDCSDSHVGLGRESRSGGPIRVEIFGVSGPIERRTWARGPLRNVESLTKPSHGRES
jgi:hypothetical protein